MTSKALAKQVTPPAELVKAARGFAEASDADNTKRAYASQWLRFDEWCTSKGVQGLPAAPEALAAYLTERALQGTSVATLSQALAAIARMHRDRELPSPTDSPKVKVVWKGIRRKKGTAQKKASPISPEQIRELILAGEPGLQSLRNAALVLVGFAGALRRSELVALRVEDVAFKTDGMRITIRRSKTDQEGEGVVVGIRRGSEQATCPVWVLETWLQASGIESGPIFRGFRGGKLSKQLHGEDVARILRAMAKRAGVSVERLSGHSLRSGLGTTAAKNGKRLEEIQRHMRHAKLEQTLEYIRDAEVLGESNVTKGIGL